MQTLHPRQTDILTIAKERGRVDVDSLSTYFKVTPQTIRKDLNELCEIEALHRVHGGAVYPRNTSNYEYQSRRTLAAEEKRKIGFRAAELIPNDASVIINIGTTTEQVAHGLINHTGLVVITNNLNVAYILSDAPDVEVIVAGGSVRKNDGGMVGATAIEVIRRFKPDFAIIGASSIDEEGCLLDYDYGEVMVTQQIIKQARRIVLVADSLKFERRAPVQIGHLKDVDIFVTDTPPPPEILERCNAENVRVECVQNGGEIVPEKILTVESL